MKIKQFQILGYLLILLIVITSCETENDGKELFEDPPWLGGTIHETLEKNGNFTNFIELIEKSGNTESIEKGLFTLFAADDDAFQEYFEKEGINSLDDVSEEEAKRLFGLCKINTPRPPQQLIYDYIWNEWMSEDSESGATMFRWETSSLPQIFMDTVKYYSSLVVNPGDVLPIKGSEYKHMPCISDELMHDFNGAPNGADYKAFFPETEWTGLQWYNASVDSVIRCSNGFVYLLDKVVPDVPNIEQYLRDNQYKYGLFYSLMQRFATYSASGRLDDGITRAYLKSYHTISDLNDEIGPTTKSWVYYRRSTFSVFIPTNDVLQEYLNNTVLKYYENIDSVPDITLAYILQGHISLQFDMLSKVGDIWFNAFGDEIKIIPDTDIKDASLLSNGPFYEMNRVLEPYAFTTVCGPLFYDSKYSLFLRLMSSAGLLPNLARPDVPATVLAPTNDKIEAYGIRYNSSRRRLEKINANENWDPLSSEDILDFAKNHFLFGNIDNFSGDGIVEMNNYAPVYFDNNTIISGGNQEDGDVANITETIDSEVNGKLMLVDNVVKPPKYDLANLIGNNPNFSKFFDLCAQVGMVDTVVDQSTNEDILSLAFLSTSLNWTAFIPSNDAITNAEGSGSLPTDSATITDFIKYHFVGEKAFTDYEEVSATFQTARVDTATNANSTLTVAGSSKNLQVTDLSGKQVDIPHSSANLFTKNGILHTLDEILEFE